MTLDQVPGGSRIFIDATIFIYHFTGTSLECRHLLQRCEARDLAGLTSAGVLAEVTHRLIMIEALSKGLVAPGNLSRKLRERPELVRQLQAYQVQVDRIPLMGIEVVPIDLGTLSRSGDVRSRHGLLTNDSLVVTALSDLSVRLLASADADFERIGGFELYGPADIQPLR